jgi:hypothetical protein
MLFDCRKKNYSVVFSTDRRLKVPSEKAKENLETLFGSSVLVRIIL